MGPNLALEYNSEAGSDWLGAGWSLTGLGSIERRGSNHSGPPTYTSSDTFVLQLGGSQKLVYTGKDLAGNVGSYYHAQIENYLRIEFVIASNSWVVTDKGGTKYFFGQSAASQHSNPGNAAQVFSWKLDQVLDAHGVFWTAYYRKYAEGDMYPQQIVYSRAPWLACMPFALASCRVVDFIPDPVARSDPQASYSTGAKIVWSHRLQRIEVNLGGQLLRKYTLAYSMSTPTARADRSVSQLTSVTETGADGTTSLPATIFTYNVDAQGSALTLSQVLMSGDPAAGLGGALQNPASTSNCTHQIDMNNDKLDDILVGLAGNYLYYPNLGNDRFDTRISIPNPPTWFPTLCSISVEKWRETKRNDRGELVTVEREIITPVHDTSVIDLNGDGLPDVVNSPGIGQWFWWRNLGNGQFADRVPISQAPSGIQLKDKGVRFADMNDDGLLDLVLISCLDGASARFYFSYWKNLGSGQFSPTSTMLGKVEVPFSLFASITSCGTFGFSHISLIDLNTDGLPDIVMWGVSLSVTGGTTRYYLPNQGGSSLGNAINLKTSSGADLPFVATEDSRYRWVDMNRDGLVDYLVGTAGAYSYYPNFGYSGSGNHVLGGVVNLGGSPSVDLNRSTYMEVADMNGDGYPDFLQGNPGDYRDYRLDYSDAHRHMETARTPLGAISTFYYGRLRSGNTIRWVPNSVTSNDGLGLTGTTTYSFSGGLFKGWPYNEFRGYELVYQRKGATAFKLTNFHQDDALKSRVVGVVEGSEYQNAASNSFETNTDYSYATSTSNSVTRVDLSGEQVQGYKKDGVLATKHTAYGNYDAYGNPRLVTVTGDGVTTRVTATDYVYNTMNYIVNRPSRTETRINSAIGTKISESWFNYDGQANGIFPTKGDVTSQTNWFSDGTSPVTTFAYDNSGNRVGTKDAKLNVCGSTTHTSYVAYDDLYQAYPVRTINALCQTTTSTYWGVNNTALTAASVFGAFAYPGALATTTDLNNVRSDSYYDALGRPKASVIPPDTAAAPTTVLGYSLTGSAPSTSSVSQRKVAGGGTLDSVTYNDGLGRPVQTKRESELAGQWITQDTGYNARGWVETVSVPYLTGSKAYSVRDTNQPKTTTLYDDVGRPTKVTNPDGTFSTRSYSGWNLPNSNVISTDERGFATTRTYDALNRLSNVVEPSGGGTTTYTYDEFDFTGKNTQKITDTAYNIVLKTEFDTLGRKVSDYDADRGGRSYTYDANGNVLTQTDAKNQKITFAYDALNRPKTKTYPDAQAVRFNYDDATAGTYRIGRLWSVTDLSGSTTTSFDQRGRQVQTDKVIGATLYTTRTTYDSLDRVDTLTYPDNEMVQNTYNAQGLLAKVSSLSFGQDYVTRINYNALGKVTSKTLGNGKVTTYNYYDWALKGPTSFRLRSLYTPGLQNLFYTYDATGNIKTIGDALKAGTQSFDYDALNRLGLASSTAAPGFNHDYTYNAIGNLTSGAGTSFTFGPPGSARPHTPTGTTGGCSFSYDNNGNLYWNICGAAWKYYVWDYDNRLIQAYSPNLNTYTYDFAGKRVSRNENGVITQTPFPHYYVKGGAVTKYYSANGERVAERTGPSATDVHYYHSDHLGSSNIVSNSVGAEVKATLFYPFGSMRSESGSKTLEHKYTGKDFDPATGLYYYGARYYDPSLMRFISADSIIPNRADPQSLNRYSYVLNNPIKYVDPTGNDPVSTVVKYGGRLGSQETRQHVVQVAQEWMDKGWKLVAGGGDKEEYLRAAAGTTRGSAYPDVTLKNPATGEVLRINTVDTLANGITPSAREAANAVKIEKLTPGDQLLLVPKPGRAAAGAAGLVAGSAEAGEGSDSSWSMFGVLAEAGTFLLDIFTPGGIADVGSGSDIVPFDTYASEYEYGYDEYEDYDEY